MIGHACEDVKMVLFGIRASRPQQMASYTQKGNCLQTPHTSIVHDNILVFGVRIRIICAQPLYYTMGCKFVKDACMKVCTHVRK